MRIGIDCLNFNPNYIGGTNTYILGLLDGFSKQDHKNHYVIFCSEKNYDIFERFDRFKNFSRIIVKVKWRIFYSLLKKFIYYTSCSSKLLEIVVNHSMRKIAILIDNSCDLFYCFNTLLSVYNLKSPTLVSMHDIQQFHYPEFFTWQELRYRRAAFEATIKNATFIQSSSYFVKNDIVFHYTLQQDSRFVVIPEGVAVDVFQQRPANLVVKERLNLPEKYLFLPAQLWKHKNHITVLRALKLLRDRYKVTYPLVMTGAKYSSSREILGFIASNKLNCVTYLGKVSFADLLDLYHGAWFLIMPTLFESSSLPILEAAAVGLPILASHIDPIVEMSKRFDISLFDPLDENSIASVIMKCWDDHDMRSRQINWNRESVKSNDWARIAEKYENFFASISIKQ